MSQERLNGLKILCIEKKLLDEIDIDTIIIDFVSKNIRKNFWGNIYSSLDINVIYTIQVLSGTIFFIYYLFIIIEGPLA